MINLTGKNRLRSPRQKSSHIRADLALVEAGLFQSRAKAQEAIAAGLVQLNGKLIVKPAELVEPGAGFSASAPYPWVSRGGVKLAAALAHFRIDPAGSFCLDIGASTGGFTDCLLENGAAHVLAVDVGHGQLHSKFLSDSRVKSLEGFDARNLTRAHFEQQPKVLTCDVSFISLDLILPKVLPLLGSNAKLIILIKPQFEAGPKASVKGIIKDKMIAAQVCQKIETLIENLGWQVLGQMPSPIEGGDGNQEFLMAAQHP